MHNIKELKIWNKSIDLAIDIYESTAKFPPDERFGLTSQARRCAISISLNISEETGRNTKEEFKQFLGITNGSSYELTQIVIANKLEFIDDISTEKILNKIDEIQKMNCKLQKSLENI
ncbi:four helix bundle protein [Pseudopedobacter sp.]|uniref:four helix bundle protein n=1 Tax=Pseudopedobacter sp. TaxID=1936787 RepID=UPI0033428994